MKIRKRLYEIIFEADTRAGKLFDIILLVLIIISIILVMLESVKDINNRFAGELKLAEWIITVFFTLEYLLRIYVVNKPVKYIRSFFGIIDLLSILPSFLDLLITGAGGLMVIRAIRLLRIFRILKLSRFVNASSILIQSLKESRQKIAVFLTAVITIVIILGTIMYLVEGEENGFTSIPQSIYWAVVTLTTVGYGDIAPHTVIGKFLASVIMILGYGMIAVPTGIVTVAFSRKEKHQLSTQVCPNCLTEGHDKDAVFCKYCGQKLNP